ncbi:MAG: transcription-repair coupling factor [Acidobacteria bacterium]|nr:transcription-repair coupling factor [Acidobacteriota bacterium]
MGGVMNGWGSQNERLRASDAYQRLRRDLGPASGLPAEAAAWIHALLAEEREQDALVIVPRESAALAWQAAAELFGHAATFFSPPSLTPYQSAALPMSIAVREVVTLDRLARGEARILITTPAGLFRKLPSQSALSGRAITVERGEELDLDALIAGLLDLGFERVDLVEEVGGFAVRGGIVDCFPPGLELPLRFDFFGDQIESLRSFDPGDQRSREEIASARLLPLTLFETGVERMARLGAILLREGADLSGEEKARVAGLLEGVSFPGWQELLPVLEIGASTVLDWLQDEPLICVFEPGDVLAEVSAYAERLASDREHKRTIGELALAEERLLHSKRTVETMVEAAALTISNSVSEVEAVSFGASSTDLFHNQLQRFPAEVAAALARHERVVIAAPSEHRGRLEAFCESYGLAFGAQGVSVVAGELDRGFRLPAAGLSLFSEDQLFRRVAPRRSRRRGAVFFSGLRDLKLGDFIVHEDHGIGQFVGLRSLGKAADDDSHVPETLRLPVRGSTLGGVEALEIRYAGSRTLLLPPSGLDRMQRYMGFDGVAPKLDRLGGTSWVRKRDRVKSGMRRMAGDLLKLYAERQLARAPEMAPDSDLQSQFDAAFDYEPTEDQLQAILAVKEDLEDSRPMDRLLCGDVGFGKTEVAMRAAFKVVDGGFQVAVLAPTTILADQHLETFRKRFAGFPVEVDMVSRFRTTKEVAAVRERLSRGAIDILIGTHRLLSQDVEFSKLGLLIIDEEQRFGVAQKERVRKLKKDVHVLAMTATPVPRTLQLSLAGVRDLSTIETPPRGRMAVETAIVPFGRELVREAIEYELDRGGQIYYVYNRVESIEEMAQQLSEICPRARIVIGHGRLSENQLAKRMRAFKAGDYDLLLASTIIENGIDIPNVNTILVHRAERFGLSQLYQLRGRVGRSRRLAFCYLMTPPRQALTALSRKRLEAIREFTELGAGFRVAARDLEIRGAGDLLGAEQSGHIAAVGLETYLKMLDETVRELRGEVIVDSISTAIELPFELVVPEEYLAEQNLRLELYRQIAAGEGSSEELLAELRDRYGEPPKSVHRLLEVSALKRLAESLRVQSITGGSGTLKIRFRHDTRIAAEDLIRFVGERDELSFSPSGVLTWAGVPDERLVMWAHQALEELSAN